MIRDGFYLKSAVDFKKGKTYSFTYLNASSRTTKVKTIKEAILKSQPKSRLRKALICCFRKSPSDLKSHAHKL